MKEVAAAVDPLQLPDGSRFEAAWLRFAPMPIAADQRAPLLACVSELEAAASRLLQRALVHEVYLQMSQVERPSGPLLLSRNAPRWLPSPGVGVWPDKEPPRSLTRRDFELVVPGDPMPATSYQVQRLRAPQEAMRLEAIGAMRGTGALLTLLVPEEWTAAMARISASLESLITDESLRGHPFYAPLLDRASLEAMPPQHLEACLDEVVLYLREDTREQALLVVTRIPLRTLLDAVASQRSGSQGLLSQQPGP